VVIDSTWRVRHQHGLNGTWGALARHWINEGAYWPQIVATLGLDRVNEDAERRDLTEKLEQRDATIKRRDATIEHSNASTPNYAEN
jgi:hypothetical protein